jgi:hypothetical protein
MPYSGMLKRVLWKSKLAHYPRLYGYRLALLAIRLFVSVNLLYAAIFLKFAGVPDSVALVTQMSQAVHGLVSQPVFRLGSGGVRDCGGGSAPDPGGSQIGSGIDCCVDDCP